MTHAFLSYVRDDTRHVQYVAEILKHNGVPYWLDTNDLEPGLPWSDQLRRAIQAGAFFVPFFSKAWAERESTTANEELLWAIEELRKRPSNRAWFVPFVLEGGQVPDKKIGGGDRLTDIQYISVDALGWQAALRKLLRALGVADPILESGEPLADGIGGQVNATGGWITCDELTPPVPAMKDLEFQIVGGAIYRDDDGRIVADLSSKAPNTQAQAVNEMFGLDRVLCFSTDARLSDSPESPSQFVSEQAFVLPRGTQLPAMLGHPGITLPMDLRIGVQ